MTLIDVACFWLSTTTLLPFMITGFLLLHPRPNTHFDESMDGLHEHVCFM